MLLNSELQHSYELCILISCTFYLARTFFYAFGPSSRSQVYVHCIAYYLCSKKMNHFYKFQSFLPLDLQLMSVLKTMS